MVTCQVFLLNIFITFLKLKFYNNIEMISKNFLIREYNKDKLADLESKLSSSNRSFDLWDINKWTKKILINFHSQVNEKEFLALRFKILKKWFLQNEQLNSKFCNEFKRNIKKLNLQNYLNANEINYIYKLESYIFFLNRNIKSLIVSIELLKNEEAYFHYENLKLFEYDKKNYKSIISGDLYITNQRIVVTNLTFCFSILINQIKNIQNSKNCIYIFTSDKRYGLFFDDVKLLLFSLYKIFELNKIKVTYDRER